MTVSLHLKADERLLVADMIRFVLQKNHSICCVYNQVEKDFTEEMETSWSVSNPRMQQLWPRLDGNSDGPK